MRHKVRVRSAVTNREATEESAPREGPEESIQ